MTNEELALKIQRGEDVQESLKALYLQNIGMISKIVSRYADAEDLDDLKQEAFFGIVKAAELWNQETGAPFINYAVYHVRRVIVEYLRKDQFGVSDHVLKDLSRYRKAVKAYREKYLRYPSDPELCEILDISQRVLDTIRRADNTRSVSITAPIGGEEGDALTLEELLADPAEPFEGLLDRIQGEELARDLWSCVDDLDVLQRDVIRDRYRNDHTRKECSEALGLPIETVKRSEAKGLRELRKPKHAHKLLPYLTRSGAHSFGLRGTGLGTFSRYGSSQELAMMKLEMITGINLNGGKIDAESEDTEKGEQILYRAL